MKAIIHRAVPPMVEGHLRCTAAPIVSAVAGARVERQLTDVFTAPDWSAFDVSLADLIESVLER